MSFCIGQSFVNPYDKVWSLEILGLGCRSCYKPDKGCGIILVDKSKYVVSLTGTKSDTTKFIALAESPRKFTLKIEDKINYFLRKLKSTRTISDDF